MLNRYKRTKEQLPLAQSIEQTHAFFDPQHLAELLIKYDGKIAIVTIDVQARFCAASGAFAEGSQESDDAAGHIASIIPQFRKAGLPVYNVYFVTDGDNIDYYKYIPADNDKTIVKDTPSAFKGSDIENILKDDGIELLLICGFKYSECVYKTVQDAREAGLEICLMDDLTKDGWANVPVYKAAAARHMQKIGAHLTTSDAVLNIFRSRRSPNPDPRKQPSSRPFCP